MQLSWLWRGVRTGIRTTRYPKTHDEMPPGWRGIVVIDPARCRPDEVAPCIDACLPRALVRDGVRIRLVESACIACGLCLTACPAGAITMTEQYELARRTPDVR